MNVTRFPEKNIFERSKTVYFTALSLKNTSMINKILALSGSIVFALSTTVLLKAQTQNEQNLSKIDVPKYLISKDLRAVDSLPQKKVYKAPVASLQTQGFDVLYELSKVYKLHLNAVDAQLVGDLVAADDNIQEAVISLQSLLLNNPELEQNKRYQQAYRTVMTEYQHLYQTEDQQDEVSEVFEIRNEIFFLEDENVDPEFSFPTKTPTNFQVPLIRNGYVNNHLKYLAVKRPEVMEKWLQRSEVYFPMMLQIFKEEKAPEELVHLAMIESGLVPVARSHAKAVGMWQFIYSTGAMYGLEVNYWVDERQDPEKATRAAARHLRDLYNIWGDWHLALANYNVSPGRIKRSIRASNGVKDYWVIYPYLPRETRGYVPSFIATTMIATNPEDFGFKSRYGLTPYAYDLFNVEGSISLKILAECAGVSTDSLQRLNPELLRMATPPGKYAYPLKIPKGSKERFEMAYKDIPREELKSVGIHIVSKNESLGKIAGKYGVTIRDLYEYNQGLTTVIHPGQKITIPVPDVESVQFSSNMPSGAPVKVSSGSSNSSSRSQYPPPPNSTKLVYKVKTGDTIGHIAEWYGTQAWKIRSWNNTNNMIRVGQKLVVYVPSSQLNRFKDIETMSFAQKQASLYRSNSSSNTVAVANSDELHEYKVQANDNLYEIARAHNTTVGEIQKINGLRGSRIYVGQKLYIRKGN